MTSPGGQRSTWRLLALYAAGAWAAAEVLFTVREGWGLPAQLDAGILALFIVGGLGVLLHGRWQQLAPSGLRGAGLAWAAAVILALTGMGLYQWFAPPAAGGGIRSVAVLPCSYSGDAEHDYLGVGLAQELHSRLSALPQLRVPAWRSVLKMQEIGADVTALAQQLRLDRITTCTVDRSGERIRIDARLIDTTDGGVIWSQQYNQASSGVVQLVSQLAVALADQLWLRMGAEQAERLARLPTSSQEAYEAYLRANALRRVGRAWYFLTPEDYAAAAELYQRAVELDPRFADAYAGLAQLHADFRNRRPSDSGSDSQEQTILSINELNLAARQNAQKAMELDECSARGIRVYADTLGDIWQGEEAVERQDIEPLLRKALECSPNDPDSWYDFAEFLVDNYNLYAEERYLERNQALKKAWDLAPTECAYQVEYIKRMGVPELRGFVGMLAYDLRQAGEYPDPPPATWALIRSMLEIDPDCGDLFVLISDIAEAHGKLDETIAWYKKAYDLNPGIVWTNSRMGWLYMQAGMFEEATPYIEKALSLRYNFAFQLDAMLRLVRDGDPERSIRLGDEVFETLDTFNITEPDTIIYLSWKGIHHALEARRFDTAMRYVNEGLRRIGESDPLVLIGPADEPPRPVRCERARKLAMTLRANDQPARAAAALELAAPPCIQWPSQRYHYPAAAYFALLGDREAALGELALALEEGPTWMEYGSWDILLTLPVDPVWDELRDDPEFQTLVERHDRRLEPMRERLRQARHSGDWEPLLKLPEPGA